MPPKKNEPPPPTTEDLNPYGYFIAFEISNLCLSLELPQPSAPDKIPSPPSVIVTVQVDSCPVIFTSGPILASSDGSTYDVKFLKRYRIQGTLESLHSLINGRIRISVTEFETSRALAFAVLDVMWNFALGQTTWSNADPVVLNPTESALTPSSANLSALRTTGNALDGIRLRLEKRPAPPGVSIDTTSLPAQSVPEIDLPPFEPFSFLTPEEAEAGNFVELSPMGFNPAPASFVKLGTADPNLPSRLPVSLGVRIPGGPAVIASGGLYRPSTAASTPSSISWLTIPTVPVVPGGVLGAPSAPGGGGGGGGGGRSFSFSSSFSTSNRYGIGSSRRRAAIREHAQVRTQVLSRNNYLRFAGPWDEQYITCRTGNDAAGVEHLGIGISGSLCRTVPRQFEEERLAVLEMQTQVLADGAREELARDAGCWRGVRGLEESRRLGS
mmetsp:Transcript_4983/g.9196  ORF Transcript_4983/g.9196 Transcript_4983/m.9196 type:complete len:441 (+) Transcript_4983:45-1367(+)